MTHHYLTAKIRHCLSIRENRKQSKSVWKKTNLTFLSGNCWTILCTDLLECTYTLQKELSFSSLFHQVECIFSFRTGLSENLATSRELRIITDTSLQCYISSWIPRFTMPLKISKHSLNLSPRAVTHTYIIKDGRVPLLHFPHHPFSLPLCARIL